MRSFRRTATIAVALSLSAVAALATTPEPQVLDDPKADDCMSDDNDRRITGCSALIDRPDTGPEQLSLAHGLRALAYSLKGMFAQALNDYDKAIKLNPNFAAALNNRAWAYFKLGQPEQGEGDVERALQLSPGSPYALDTRAHIKQSQGAAEDALKDYDLAMRYGGRDVILMYQCGLRSHGLYFGQLDGRYSRDLFRALRTCVFMQGCDPLPADEDCRPAMS